MRKQSFVYCVLLGAWRETISKGLSFKKFFSSSFDEREMKNMRPDICVVSEQKNYKKCSRKVEET